MPDTIEPVVEPTPEVAPETPVETPAPAVETPAPEVVPAFVDKPAEDLKQYIGKTFTNGTEEVTVSSLSQPISVRGKNGAAFYVSTKNPLVKRPVNAQEFLSTYTLKQ